jgi:hypothetical protein
MKMRNLRCVAATIAIVAASLSSAAPLHAQAGELAAIDSLISSSRFRDASAALDRWERANATTVTPAERATAMLLRARLIQDGDSARDMYMSLSLTYPSTPEAAVALLRLGQIAFTADDRTRAESYFQRIISDHPRSAVQPDAVAWLARVRDGGPAPAPVTAKPSVASPPAAKPAPTDADAANGAFALQVGAFRAANTARTVVRQLEKAGFDARAVTVPANQLVRVRVGRFATSRAAEDTMRRLRAAGFEAVIVSDARTEKDA